MTDTINDATTYALRREGYRQKQWSTVIDGRERETHAAANGQVVGIDDPFRIGGASWHHPGDPHLPVVRNRLTVDARSSVPASPKTGSESSANSSFASTVLLKISLWYH